MADSFTQVPPDSTGDKIDTEQLTVNAQTVERQRIQLAGTADTAIAPVTLADGLLVNLGNQNDVVAAGDIAHDSPDSGNPVKIGGKAFTTLPAAAATSDRVDQTMTVDGGAMVAGVDGTTPRNIAVNASGQLEVDIAAQQTGDVNISLAGEAVILGAGTAEIGKLAAGVASIGTVLLGAGTAEIGKLAAGVAEIGSLGASTNNIGDVDVLSIAAGTNSVGSVVVSGTHLHDDLAGGLAQVEVKFASVDVASSGDNTIVSLVSGKELRVISYVLVASGGANTVQWKSSTAGARTGGMGLADTGGISASEATGLFDTVAGEALVLNLSAATSVDGHISYIEVD